MPRVFGESLLHVSEVDAIVENEARLLEFACHSTAKDGTVSRIVPQLEGPVTTPRNDTHIVATEYGWVDLKGKSLRERAGALIGIAHPKFRDELRSAHS